MGDLLLSFLPAARPLAFPHQPPKINLEKVENFSLPKYAVNKPRKTTQPPQTNHQKPSSNTRFSQKPPAKTHNPPSKKTSKTVT
jgi:hypothetical protein